MAALFENLRVLDLSWGIAGPMTTMLLTDHGANVIKIEPPGGDPFRHQTGYIAWNRGKRSAELDLKQESDLNTLLDLARDADILVESFAPGTTTRLGIDYEALRAANPRLIYCSITAYGAEGKHADRPGYDALVMARTGLMWEQRGWPEGALNHMSKRPDPFPDLDCPWENLQGPPRPGPIYPASSWPSLGAFYSALTAISAALFAREQSGCGQHVETSLLQGALACGAGAWQRAEKPEAPMYDSWILNSKSPKGHFLCSDGRWIHNWVPNPRFILTASEGDQLNSNADLTVQNDPDRFGMGPEEVFVMHHYQPILAERVARFTADEWTAAAAVAGMTIQPVRRPEEALTDPAFLADGCVTELEDPTEGLVRQVGLTLRLDSSPGAIRGPQPRVGEHTEEVRKEAQATRRTPPPAGNSGSGRPPLHGITVLDLGLAIAGPFSTQLLSDLGARVIKINTLYDMYWHANHIAGMANRGKESISLNLKDPRGMEILRKLVEQADVVQHNMRYAAAERLGVDYASLKKVNPRLVYCHTRGFEKGDRAELPGNDQTGACLTGVQYEDGGMADGGKPLWSFTSLGDTGNGFLAASGIIQALYHREKTGEGQMVDTSIVNAHMLNVSYAIARPDGTPLPRAHTDGLQTGFNALNRLYQCGDDSWICLAVITPAHWARLRELPPFADTLNQPAFASPEGLKQADGELAEALAAIFAGNSGLHWQQMLDEAAVPAEICSSDFAQNMHDDPEMIERQLVTSYQHPVVGKLDQIGLLFNLSETPGVVQGPPLMVGQHTRAILAELGYAAAHIDTLCDEKCVLEWQSA
jgi:crotonobetainyl-CoA:carnitine CoA-transferase CaiB-like acyl-CoA transferase